MTLATRKLLERYLDAQVFHDGIMALCPTTATDEAISQLFNMIATTNHPVPHVPDVHALRQQNNSGMNSYSNSFHLSQKASKKYCDIWMFLSLLKECSDDDRRGYDLKTSNLACTVEFWNQNRAKIPNEIKPPRNNNRDEIVSNIIRHTSKSTLHREAVTAGKNNGGAVGMIKKSVLSEELTEKVWDDTENVRQRLKERAESVSALLGCQLHQYGNNPVDNRGRGVLGQLQAEVNKRDAITTVLHSPIRPDGPGNRRSDKEDAKRKSWASTEETWSDTAMAIAAATKANSQNAQNEDPQSDKGNQDSTRKSDLMINYLASLKVHGSVNTSGGSGSSVHHKQLPSAWEREGTAVAAALHPIPSNAPMTSHYAAVFDDKSHEPDIESSSAAVDVSIIDTKQPKRRLSNSYNSLQKESYNKTTVADALGCNREDNVGRQHTKQIADIPPALMPTKLLKAMYAKNLATQNSNNNSFNMSSLLFPASVV
jgi:hypothetical protein